MGTLESLIGSVDLVLVAWAYIGGVALKLYDLVSILKLYGGRGWWSRANIGYFFGWIIDPILAAVFVAALIAAGYVLGPWVAFLAGFGGYASLNFIRRLADFFSSGSTGTSAGSRTARLTFLDGFRLPENA